MAEEKNLSMEHQGAGDARRPQDTLDRGRASDDTQTLNTSRKQGDAGKDNLGAGEAPHLPR